VQKIKKILIFGYGDLGTRVKALEANYLIYVHGISRSQTKVEDCLTQWDWTANQELPENILNTEWDSMVIILKPTSFDESGYHEGYCEGLLKLAKATKNIQCKRVIFISSTRVYGNQGNPINQDTKAIPSDFRGAKLLEAESIAAEYFGSKLTILRFSGLYKENLDLSYLSPQKTQQILSSENINRLSRNDAALIIASVCSSTSMQKEILICSEPTFNCKDHFESEFPEYQFNDSFVCKEQGKIFLQEALYSPQ
jgi:nucleoside-diphosphate-sugar epimerase